jgi:hypothetical protein
MINFIFNGEMCWGERCAAQGNGTVKVKLGRDVGSHKAGQIVRIKIEDIL